MKSLSCFFSALIICSGLSAQQYLNYAWEANPVLDVATDTAYTNAGAYYILDNSISEYRLNRVAEVFEYYDIAHKRIKINTAEGLESFNKVYVPLSNVEEIIDIRARTISAAGVIRELKKSEIREVENVENAGDYKIFALEGAELGGEIEYIYILKKGLNFLWAEFVNSENYPKKEYSLSLYSPADLVFDAYVFNDTVKPVDSTDEDGNNYVHINFTNVPVFRSEPFDAGKANSTRIEVKLLYNKNTSSGKLYTFTKGAEYLYTEFMEEKKANKDIVKELKKEVSLKGLDTFGKVRAIEDYVKRTYMEYGSYVLTRLFVEFLKAADIETVIGTTTSRFNRPFSTEFETWNFLDEYLVYIPEIKQYAQPASLISRVGYVEGAYTNTKGLFVKEIKAGDIYTAIPDIKFIDPIPADSNMDNLDIEFSMMDDFYQVKGTVQRTFTGLSAYYQPFYRFFSDKDKEDNMRGVVEGMVGEGAIISDLEVENYEEEDLYRKPFILKCGFQSNGLVENAGDKYLVKIGELIGEQSEMYSETERKYGIENQSNHGYVRKLVFNIPDGYTISNPEALQLDAQHDYNGSKAAYFKSYYTLEGNKLTVTIEEYYYAVSLPKTEYENFRQVINAAADFNKIKLILSPN